MKEKLKSKKLWIAVGVAALSALVAELGFDTRIIDLIFNK